MQVIVEGNASALYNSTPSAWAIVEFTSQAVSTDGILDITIHDAGGDWFWALNAIEIAPAGSLPANPAPLAGASTLADADAGTLTAAQLQPVIEQAIDYWTASGITAAEQQQLSQVQFQITDMNAAGHLGLATGNSIKIDDNALGHGWMVEAGVESGEWRVEGGGSRAYSLLTVVTHELGHVLGHGDLEPLYAPGHIMGGRLEPGEIRVGQALPDAISINPVAEVQSGIRQAQPDLQRSATPDSSIDEIFSDHLINDLRYEEEDEEDLLAALLDKHEREEQAEDTLFTELGQM
jgi:hypothetical protein